MNIFRAVARCVKDKNYRFAVFNKLGFYNNMPDEVYLTRKFKLSIGYDLDLHTPQTFNEKLQWLKLYDRNPQYTLMVDKYRVKDYVADKIGRQFIIPTIEVWDNPDDIDFSKLPNQFVLKCNHNSGLGMCICKDKSKLDFHKVKAGLRKGLKQDYYLHGREWPYKNVPRKIIAEEFMTDNKHDDLIDYKFMCFNGAAKCLFTCSDRRSASGLKVTFFDMDWNRLSFERHYHAANYPIYKPINFNLMKELAEVLAKDMIFARIDFYEINGKVYFGEITLHPGCGFEEFTPEEWDRILGNWITLPDKSI